MAAGDGAGATGAGGTQRPGGPSTEWLILQRLDDLRRGQDELRNELRQGLQEVRRGIDSLRSWSLGLLLLAILGLLAKLLIPGA
jgi:hypothetical protein